MGRCERLIEKARRAPGSLRFEEACRLAACFGFEPARQSRGRHRVFKRPGVQGLVNLQNRGGKAVAYQVRQILALADEHGMPED